MRRFYLNRLVDASGVSGRGIVAEGVVFENGKVVLQWRTDTSSITLFDNLDDVKAVHGHQGQTQVIFFDAVPSKMWASRPAVTTAAGNK